MIKSKKRPLVSVIIPAYNHEKYIQETIFSIINQTYNKIELLIIDDGSNDLTYDKICELENLGKKRFVRFDFIRHENMGVIDTLNKLIGMTNGDYIFLTASDDVAAPHAIETELNFLSNNTEYALCVGNNDIIDESSCRSFWDKKRNNIYYTANANYISFSDLLIQAYPEINFFSDEFGSYYNLIRYGNHVPNGYLVRKSIFSKTGLYTKKAPLEDYWIMMQIAKNAKMKFLSDTLFFYRWHGKNAITNVSLYNEYTYRTLSYEYFVYFNNEIISKKNQKLEIRMNNLRNKFLLQLKNKKYNAET